MIQRLETAEEACQAAAWDIASAILVAETKIHIALSGGSTPVPAFRFLREMELPWEKVELWLVDDRFAPASDSGSNAKLVMDELVIPLGLRSSQFHPMVIEENPEKCAEEYEKILPAQLDYVMLGMGDDGHCASLFPGSPSLAERQRRVVAAPGADPYPQRITLTFPPICEAVRTVALVTGASKAKAFADSLQEGSELPIAYVANNAADYQVFLDESVY